MELHTRDLRQFANRSLTDKEIFMSSRYSNHFQNLADMITERYGETVVVNLIWNSKGEELAYTDGNKITINLGHELALPFKREEKHLYYISLLIHECAHILYTDFTIYQDVNTDNWLPQIRKMLIDTCIWHNDVVEAYQNKKEQFKKILKQIFNCVEDRYVDNRISIAYPGLFKKSIDFYKEVSFECDKEEIEEYEKNIFNCILNQIVFESLSASTYEKMPLFHNTLGLVDEINTTESTEQRMNITYEYMVFIWEYLKKYFQEDKQDNKETKNKNTDKEKDCNDQSSNSSPNLQLDNDQNESRKYSATGNRNSKPASSKATSSQAISADKQDNDSGDTDGDFLNEVIKELVDKVMKNPAKLEKLEQQLSEFRAGEASNNLYHRNISHDVISPSHNKALYMSEIKKDNLFDEVRKISKRLQKKMLLSLVKKEKGLELNNLPFGRKIDSRALARGDAKMFSKTVLPNKKPEISFALILDESGSMGIDNRIDKTRFAALILEDFCREMSIPLYMIGHTENNGQTNFFEYVRFDDKRKKENRNKILSVTARSNNRDGYALRFAFEQIKRRRESVKNIIIISDGKPNAQGYDYATGKEDIKECIKQAKRQKVNIIALAIGDDKEKLYDIYGERLITVYDLNELPQKLVKQITKFM